MNNSILELAKSYLNEGFVQSAASKLGENSEGIQKALTVTVPTVLAGIEHKAAGDSSFMSVVLDKAKEVLSSNGLGKLTDVLGQTPTDLSQPGAGFFKSIYGNTVHIVTDKLGAFAGIKQSSAHALLNASSIAALGSLGKDAADNGFTANSILDFFKNKKSEFLSVLPESFGIGSVLPQIHYDEENTVNTVKTEVRSAAKNVHASVAPTPKKKCNWWWWLLGLLILLLLLFFLFKGCKKSSCSKSVPVIGLLQPDTSVALPSGATLSAFKGGIEQKVVAFLQSPEYKNATEDSLKGKWFNFDKVSFKTGATVLDSASYPQINNLISILKEFPDAKIKIGGYTDKTGDSIANQTLSQQRADVLKSALAAVNAQIAGAEGYGQQFAKYPASAPDSLRAFDRSMKIRFVK